MGNFKPLLPVAHRTAGSRCRCRLARRHRADRHATLAALEEGMKNGLQDMDVGAMLKMREEQVGVTVRLSPPAKTA